MPHPPFGSALRHWLHRISEPTASHSTDAQLLERFISQRDETAFAAMVQRHGSLVLSVCRGILRDSHDAEDAFQATFLVLACRAGAIQRTESLASFLHGTALRIAKRLCFQKARDRLRQREAALQLSTTAPESPDDREAHALLHEELNRLPRKYRDALVLCYLQGKTNEQAARELGCPPGSMSRHLSRARELLRDRLLGRGIGAALAVALLNERARAAASAALVQGTLDLVRRHTLAAALLAGSTPPAAVLLAQGILRGVRLGRVTLISAMLALGIVFAGGVAAWQTPPASRPEAKTPPPRVQKQARPRVDFYGDPLPEGVLARMGTSQLRHGQATRLVFTADGKTLISAGGHTVCFWDVASGKLRRVQHLPRTQKVEAMSVDGKMLALSSAAHLHLWDIALAKEIRSIATGQLVGPKRLLSVEFSPDGQTLAGGNVDNTVFIWDAAAGKEGGEFKHPDRLVPMLAFSPDGKRLVAVGTRRTVVWDLAAGREFRTIKDSLNFNSRPAFSPDGKLLAADMRNRIPLLWDTATGKEEAALRFDPPSKLLSYSDVAFSPDGRTISVQASDCVGLWDRSTRKLKKRWEIDFAISTQESGVLRFSPDGKRLASLRAGLIRIWDVESGKSLHERPSHSTKATRLALSPDGKHLASAGYGDNTVRLWDAHTGKPLHVWPMAESSLFFTPDGATLIAVSRSSGCRSWDMRSGELRHNFHVSDDSKAHESIPSATLSPDGKRLTAMCVHYEPKIAAVQARYLTTWDVASGKRIARRRIGLDRQVFPMLEQLSPNGQYATAYANGLMIYDVAADRPLRIVPNINIRPLAFSPDSKLLALDLGALQRPSPAVEPVRVYDIASATDVLTLPNVSAQARAFTADGRYLLTAEDGLLRLWELATGKEALRWRTTDYFRITAQPSNLAIAANGRSAAMGMSEPSVLIWDLAPATRQKHRLNAADLERLWKELAGEDAARAYHALGTLVSDPERSVPFLRMQLNPVKEDAPRIRRLVADLDSEQFAVRDAAWKELEKMDDAAHAVLRQELPKAKSLEQRRRIENLLKVGWLVQSPEKLRQIRAITALEQIGNAEARRLLQRLAEGSSEARQTREAKAALQRRTP